LTAALHADRLIGRKLVILVGTFVRGGSERQAFLLARELRQRHGLNVEVWALWESQCPKEFEAAGVPTRVLRFRRPQCPVRWVRALHWTRRVLRVIGQLREGRIDVLLPFGSWPNVIAGMSYRLAGIGLCIWGERSAGRARGERRAMRQYKCFVANSTSGVEYLTGKMEVPSHRVFLVPNAVEVPIMDSGTDWRVRLRLKPEQPLVVKVAAVEKTHDHATLLHAWKIVQESWPGSTKPVLALAGSIGDAYADCRQIVRKAGLDSTVRFLGMIDDVPALIRASDLTVFSSHGQGMPNGVLECMAGGKAVIASDLPGVREALGPNAAEVLVSPGDANGFARKLLTLLGNKNSRDALGEANLARARAEFPVERMVEGVLQIVREVLSKPGARASEANARREPLKLRA
jgi:glycosyltransferase involved in cell wall biosynthesis